MKQAELWLKTKVFIQAALLLLGASLLFTACPNAAGGDEAVETFTVTYGVENSTGGTLKAKVGTASISSGTRVEKGKTITLEAVPAEGYTLGSWSGGGTPPTGQ